MGDYLDFSTAQAALHSIAEAYRRKDIEGAVACKDFESEARLMLGRIGNLTDDQEILRETAEVLELSFRSHTQKSWPDFAGVSSAVATTEDGWKVLNPVSVKAVKPWWKFW